jgi:hypothetical protein
MPSMPEMPAPAPLPKPEPLPTPQQAPTPPVMAPQPQAVAPTPAAPLPPMFDRVDPQAPPPTLVQGQMAGQDNAIVKRRKSQRQELQQASGGTSALRIPLGGQEAIGSTPTGSTGSTGLNIPK